MNIKYELFYRKHFMMTAEKRDVLAYLKTTNRPYSANDVMLNINKGYGKTAVQRALDQLVEDGAIKEKIYGKQKVYSALQNQNEDAAEIQKELGDIDHKVKTVCNHYLIYPVNMYHNSLFKWNI